MRNPLRPSEVRISASFRRRAGFPVRTVPVVGSGIAGLSAAIALATQGGRVTVVDRSGQADGASIAITGRAVAALDDLGVLGASTRTRRARSCPALWCLTRRSS